MTAGKYILIDGALIQAEEFRIGSNELNGLILTEKFRVIRSQIPFFKETLALLNLKLTLFSQSFPEFTANEGNELKRQMERTLTRNKHFAGAVLTLRLYFTPSGKRYSIQSDCCPETGFELNEKGLYVDVFDKVLKPVSPVSWLDTGSELYWAIAESHKKNMNTDCILIRNTANKIIEIPGANICIVKDKMVTGTNQNSGAFVDITRPYVLRICNELELGYTETDGFQTEDIREADEFFSVNAIGGIRWIIGFEGKRFYNNTTKKISALFERFSV